MIETNQKGTFKGYFYAYFKKGKTVSLEVDDEGTVEIGSLVLSAKTSTPNNPASTYVPGRNSGTYSGISGMKKVKYTLVNYGGTGYLSVSGFEPGSDVVISPQSFRFSKSGGSVTISAIGDNIKSTSVGNFSGTCNLSSVGTTINCAANSTNEELASNAVVSVVVNDGTIEDIVTFDFPIYQDAGDVVDNEPGVFEVSPSSLSFTADQGSYLKNVSAIHVHSESPDFEFSYTTDSEWIHPAHNEAHILPYPSLFKDHNVHVYCDENTTGVSRTGTVTITGTDPSKIRGLSGTVTIHQSGKYLDNSQTNENGDKVVVEDDGSENIITGGQDNPQDGALIRSGYVDFENEKGSKIRVKINQINSSTLQNPEQPTSSTGTIQRSGFVEFVNSVGGRIRVNINQVSESS